MKNKLMFMVIVVVIIGITSIVALNVLFPGSSQVKLGTEAQVESVKSCN